MQFIDMIFYLTKNHEGLNCFGHYFIFFVIFCYLILFQMEDILYYLEIIEVRVHI